MPDQRLSITNIALFGGGDLCMEILEKTTSVYRQENVYAPILAVADPDPFSPGMILARELGLLTFTDYGDLYDPVHNIHLIIVLRPEPEFLEEILSTKPAHIRIMSHHVFEIFWKAIGQEERKWRERTKEMETILNGIQNLITVITPEMEIEEVNEEFLRQMHSTRDQVIGRKCYEVFQNRCDPCKGADFPCPLDEVIRNKRNARQVMLRNRSDGGLSYFEVNIYPIWEKGHRISKFIEISRDITEHKREEEEITRRLEQMVEERTRELKETHNQLLHQDKMASLGKLAASVVHEINNPVAGILNLIRLIKRILEEKRMSKGLIQQFRQYLDLMEAETKRVSQIVSNLLAFSRQSKMEMKSLDINQLVEKTLLINSNLLKISGIRVDWRPKPDLPDLVGSEDQLQQVFMNIISNAAESMEGGGTLTVATGRQGEDVLVEFSDTGNGIPPENIPRVFEPFFTTKKRGKGVGLGLSVAYGIIQEHQGSIDVRSGTGKGTTFTVSLPIQRAQ